MVPITPACSTSASAPTAAEAIRVRADRPAKNPASRLDKLADPELVRAGSASIAANSFCIARSDGAPRLSFSRMVSAYSSRIASYCRARSGSAANASSTRRVSRALSVPAACHGSSASISPGCSS